jgi:hypothetical protein
MAGGFIYEKTIDSAFQGGTDKSLLIEPNYAYQVPFTFGSDWEEIKIGMFVSFVQTGVGNENKGTPSLTTIDAGGTTNDTFTYLGLIKEQDQNSLPLSTNNSGFIGTQSRYMYVINNSSYAYNKMTHPDYGSSTLGDNKFFSSYQGQELEEREITEGQGNFNIVGTSGTTTTFAYPHKEDYFCSYWGLNYKVLNKGQSDQLISFKASQYDISSVPSSRNSLLYNRIEDPSIENLKNIINGIGEYQYPDLHNNTSTGFVWNKDASALALPDSLFFYNAFQSTRPRIHAWAVKKIS